MLSRLRSSLCTQIALVCLLGEPTRRIRRGVLASAPIPAPRSDHIVHLAHRTARRKYLRGVVLGRSSR